jgi:Na+-driven multidrug efflux pump
MGIWLTFPLGTVIAGLIVALWAKYGRWDKVLLHAHALLDIQA